MNKKIIGMLVDGMRGGCRWLVVAMMLVVAGEALGEPIGVDRVDGIIGIRQESANALGYYLETEIDTTLAGVTGSLASNTRRCKVPIARFALPALPAGEVINSVTVHYQITESRDHAGEEFDAHVYLLDSDDPSVTGTNKSTSGQTPRQYAARVRS